MGWRWQRLLRVGKAIKLIARHLHPVRLQRRCARAASHERLDRFNSKPRSCAIALGDRLIWTRRGTDGFLGPHARPRASR